MHEMYRNMVHTGFTEIQACLILGTFLAHMTNGDLDDED